MSYNSGHAERSCPYCTQAGRGPSCSLRASALAPNSGPAGVGALGTRSRKGSSCYPSRALLSDRRELFSHSGQPSLSAVPLLALGDRQGHRSRGQAMWFVSRPGPQWQSKDVRITSLRKEHPGVHAYDYSEPPLLPNLNSLKGLDEAGRSPWALQEHLRQFSVPHVETQHTLQRGTAHSHLSLGEGCLSRKF